MNPTISPLRIMAMAVLAALLAGCGGGDEAELRAWMDETRKTMRPTTQPVPEPKQFSPYVYEGKALIDPFDPQKMHPRRRPPGTGARQRERPQARPRSPA